jgi:hypothetical protein
LFNQAHSGALSAVRSTEAIKEWIRIAGCSTEVAVEAGEVHIRAIRKVGMLLLEIIDGAGETTYHHGGDEARTQPFRSLPKGALAAYNLSAKVSSESQLVARLPVEEFEARLSAMRSAGRVPTVLPFRRAASVYMQPKRRRLTPTLSGYSTRFTTCARSAG